MSFIEYVLFMGVGIMLGAILGRLFMGWYWRKGRREDVLERILKRLRGA